MKRNVNFDLEKQLSRLGHDIQQFVERFSSAVEDDENFTPACDIVENDEKFMIYLDLPGLSKEDINLGLKDNVLTIKGERSVELGEGESYRRRERMSGAFSRSFAIPEDVNTAETKAQFNHGVLKITMPKSEVLKDATSIPID